jgi:multiple sugar transport system ATP-binding protein
MARVVLDHLEKVFAGGVAAVADLCLEVDEGEFLVLVGPSGSGKTTALRLIAGLERLGRGAIRIGGREVQGLPPRDRNVAMVFQDYALYPHLTVRGNLAFPLRLRGRPRPEIRRRVADVAALLDLEPLLDRRPMELSGGEQQRVALGRALVRAPDCFLLDEPLAHLDLPLRRSARSRLKQLHARAPVTTIYVTHDQEEALALGDRIAVMRAGRLEQAGPPAEVYLRPVNAFVAGFLGDPPMNFLPGTLSQAGGRPWFDDGSQRLAAAAAAEGLLRLPLGTRLYLGVRPDALSLRPIEGRSDNVLAAAVEMVEAVGSRTDVVFSTPRHPRIVARLGPDESPAPGSVRQLYVDLDRAHYFAADGPQGGPGTRLA